MTLAQFPSIDEQIAELNAEGWKAQKPKTIWKSPSGKLFLGPHGAWKVMIGLGSPNFVAPKYYRSLHTLEQLNAHEAGV